MKDRHCDREAIRAGRNAERNTYGVIFDAIVAVGRRNGCLEVEIYYGRGDCAFEMFRSDWRLDFKGTTRD